MDLHSYIQVCRRRWVSVVAMTLVALLVGATITLLMTPKFTAETRVFFAVQASDSGVDLAQGSTFAEKQMTSYAEVATSPVVLDPVITQLKLDTTAGELAETVQATVPPGTVILRLTATDPSATQAAAIANAVGAQLSKVAVGLSPQRSDGKEAVRATTLAVAPVPILASSPKVARSLALAGAVGLLLGVGLALLRDVLDTTIRGEQDLATLTTRPVLGAIGFDQNVPMHPLIVREEPHSPPAEAIRRLRTNLQFVDVAERPRSIVVTSSIPGEGKSTTAINLAVSLSDAGSRVLLIDADLRRPSVAEYMGLEGAVGLTTVLIGKADFTDVIQPWSEGTLDILPAGQIPPNPSELLGSLAMSKLLQRLSLQYDTVLLDSPPVLPVTDAVVLSKIAGGALLVVGANQTHRAQLRGSLESLETAGAHVFGVVFNKTSRRDTSSYGYSSYGYAPNSKVMTVAETKLETASPEVQPDRESARRVKV